jgi:hypothetical protein
LAAAGLPAATGVATDPTGAPGNLYEFFTPGLNEPLASPIGPNANYAPAQGVQYASKVESDGSIVASGERQPGTTGFAAAASVHTNAANVIDLISHQNADGEKFTTSHDFSNQQPRSWRDTVIDSQNPPIQVVDQVDRDRVGNGQTQVQTTRQYDANRQPIGEPVRVVAPNGAGRRPQPQVIGGQAIGSDLGSARGQAPAAASAQETDFYSDPLADERAWNADQAVRDAVRDNTESSRQEQVTDRAAAYRPEAVAAHLARIDEAKQRIGDFDQVIRSGGQVPIAPGVADEILNSEKSALLQYHLAGNPNKLAELNGLSGLNLAREIGRLESRLHLPAAKTVTEASPPLADVRGGAAPVFDPVTTDDMDAFANWLREDQARRRRA